MFKGILVMLKSYRLNFQPSSQYSMKPMEVNVCQFNVFLNFMYEICCEQLDM